MYRNILLAYDGSPDGCEALDQVAMLASMSGATVRILAVVDTPSDLLAEGLTFVPQNEHSEIDDLLEEAVKSLQREGCVATDDVRHGNPAEQIILAAEEANTDLIVVGHRDQGTLARWLNGSVGASVLHSPPCSVLVAVKSHRNQNNVTPIRKFEALNRR